VNVKTSGSVSGSPPKFRLKAQAQALDFKTRLRLGVFEPMDIITDNVLNFCKNEHF
jgi:hypothetical protein